MDLGWDQILSLVGAFLILLAYALESLKPGYLKPMPFQLLNAVGSLFLFINAYVNTQYGFMVLEGSWFVISLLSIGRLALKKSPSNSTVSNSSKTTKKH